VSNVFYSDAFGISARGLNEVLRGRSLFGHKTTRDSAKVRLAKCILKKRKKLRLTPWERVTVWGEFPLSRSNSEFEPFGFGHHVDRASINLLEHRTTTLQNSVRLKNLQASLKREVGQIVIGHTFHSGFEALPTGRD